jgi:hypothetical protein
LLAARDQGNSRACSRAWAICSKPSKIAHPRRLFLLEGEGDGPAELYDLPHDPHEDSSLARQRPEDVARMRAEIQAWKEACDREAVLTSTPAQQEALRAMGYVELK